MQILESKAGVSCLVPIILHRWSLFRPIILTNYVLELVVTMIWEPIYSSSCSIAVSLLVGSKGIKL